MSTTYTAEDVKALLAGTIRAVKAGTMEVTTGRTISTLAGQLLKALKAQAAARTPQADEPRWNGKPLSELTQEELAALLEEKAEELRGMAATLREGIAAGAAQRGNA